MRYQLKSIVIAVVSFILKTKIPVPQMYLYK